MLTSLAEMFNSKSMTRSYYLLRTFTLHHRPLDPPRNYNTSSLALTESFKRSLLLPTSSNSPTPSKYTRCVGENVCCVFLFNFVVVVSCCHSQSGLSRFLCVLDCQISRLSLSQIAGSKFLQLVF